MLQRPFSRRFPKSAPTWLSKNERFLTNVCTIQSWDGHEEFVQVPGVAHPASAPPQPPRVVDPERLRSLPNCLVGDRDAPLSQQILDAPFPGRDTQALAKGASNLGGSSIRRLSSWTECPSNSAALASDIAPSARARKHRRSKRIGRSPGIAHGSL